MIVDVHWRDDQPGNGRADRQTDVGRLAFVSALWVLCPEVSSGAVGEG